MFVFLNSILNFEFEFADKVLGYGRVLRGYELAMEGYELVMVGYEHKVLGYELGLLGYEEESAGFPGFLVWLQERPRIMRSTFAGYGL